MFSGRKVTGGASPFNLFMPRFVFGSWVLPLSVSLPLSLFFYLLFHINSLIFVCQKSRAIFVCTLLCCELFIFARVHLFILIWKLYSKHSGTFYIMHIIQLIAWYCNLIKSVAGDLRWMTWQYLQFVCVYCTLQWFYAIFALTEY